MTPPDPGPSSLAITEEGRSIHNSVLSMMHFHVHDVHEYGHPAWCLASNHVSPKPTNCHRFHSQKMAITLLLSMSVSRPFSWSARGSQNLNSFVAQCHHGINAHRAPRRNVTCDDGND